MPDTACFTDKFWVIAVICCKCILYNSIVNVIAEKWLKSCNLVVRFTGSMEFEGKNYSATRRMNMT